MDWQTIGAVAVVLAAGIWLESKLTGTSVSLDILNPQKSTPAAAPSKTGHTSAQSGA